MSIASRKCYTIASTRVPRSREDNRDAARGILTSLRERGEPNAVTCQVTPVSEQKTASLPIFAPIGKKAVF
jgi:hypothetical protein